MKITAMEQSKSVSDVLCDICGDSTRVEGQGLQFGTLRASWGYGSAHDGERYEVHLCESCFFRTLLGLRRERMVNFMFSDEDQDLSDFGRVAHDDFFNEGGSADSTPFGHSAHADPDTCSTIIRTGSRSAATQGWHC